MVSRVIKWSECELAYCYCMPLWGASSTCAPQQRGPAYLIRAPAWLQLAWSAKPGPISVKHVDLTYTCITMPWREGWIPCARLSRYTSHVSFTRTNCTYVLSMQARVCQRRYLTIDTLDRASVWSSSRTWIEPSCTHGVLLYHASGGRYSFPSVQRRAHNPTAMARPTRSMHSISGKHSTCDALLHMHRPVKHPRHVAPDHCHSTYRPSMHVH